MSELDEGFKPLTRQKKDKDVEPIKEKKVKSFAAKIDEELVDKVNAYGYWEGFSQAEITEQALTEFFAKRDVKPLPDQVKKKMEEQAARRVRGRRGR